ncbi:MAG: nucleotidyl transferase AbiEii/AbiGii toxin family protein, partial [Myxococcota bacterium]
MTKRGDRGGAASVRARLLALSKERGEEFQRLLIRFGNERLLYRLSASEHAPSFVLKGATLFAVWSEAPHRPTKDLDLLGVGSPDPVRLVRV